MELKNVKIEMPPVKGDWSENDYLLVGTYNYFIGRLRRGIWVDMENKKIPETVEWWAELPVPPAPNNNFNLTTLARCKLSKC